MQRQNSLTSVSTATSSRLPISDLGRETSTETLLCESRFSRKPRKPDGKKAFNLPNGDVFTPRTQPTKRNRPAKISSRPPHHEHRGGPLHPPHPLLPGRSPVLHQAPDDDLQPALIANPRSRADGPYFAAGSSRPPFAASMSANGALASPALRGQNRPQPFPRSSLLVLVASAQSHLHPLAVNHLPVAAQGPPPNPASYLTRSHSFNNLRLRAKQDLVSAIRGTSQDTPTNISLQAPASPSMPGQARLYLFTNNRYAVNSTNIVRLELLLSGQTAASPHNTTAGLNSNPSSESNYYINRSNSNTPQTSVSGSDIIAEALLKSQSSCESVVSQLLKGNLSLASIQEFSSQPRISLADPDSRPQASPSMLPQKDVPTLHTSPPRDDTLLQWDQHSSPKVDYRATPVTFSGSLVYSSACCPRASDNRGSEEIDCTAIEVQSASVQLDQARKLHNEELPPVEMIEQQLDLYLTRLPLPIIQGSHTSSPQLRPTETLPLPGLSFKSAEEDILDTAESLSLNGSLASRRTRTTSIIHRQSLLSPVRNPMPGDLTSVVNPTIDCTEPAAGQRAKDPQLGLQAPRPNAPAVIPKLSDSDSSGLPTPNPLKDTASNEEYETCRNTQEPRAGIEPSVVSDTPQTSNDAGLEPQEKIVNTETEEDASKEHAVYTFVPTPLDDQSQSLLKKRNYDMTPITTDTDQKKPLPDLLPNLADDTPESAALSIRIPESIVSGAGAHAGAVIERMEFIEGKKLYSPIQIDSFLSDQQGDVPPRGDVDVQDGVILVHSRVVSPTLTRKTSFSPSHKDLKASASPKDDPTKKFAHTNFPGGRYSMLAVVDVDYDKLLPPTPTDGTPRPPDLLSSGELYSPSFDDDVVKSPHNSPKSKQKSGMKKYFGFLSNSKPQESSSRANTQSSLRNVSKGSVSTDITSSSYDARSDQSDSQSKRANKKKGLLSLFMIRSGMKQETNNSVGTMAQLQSPIKETFATEASFDLPNYEVENDHFEDVLQKFDEVEKEVEKEVLNMKKAKSIHDFFLKDDELTRAQIFDQQRKDVQCSDESLPARMDADQMSGLYPSDSDASCDSIQKLPIFIGNGEFEFPAPGETQTISLHGFQVKTVFGDPKTQLDYHIKNARQFADFLEIKINLSGFDPTYKAPIGTLSPLKSAISHGNAKKASRKVKFSNEISISETFAPVLYKRNNKSVTQYYVTELSEINKIKNDLNAYKCYEMLVHEKSQMNTHFYY